VVWGFLDSWVFFFFWVLRQKTDSSLRKEKWEWVLRIGGRRGEREKERMQGRTTRGQARREGGTAVSPRHRVRHKQARATQIVCVAGCQPTLADKEANTKKTPSDTEKYAHQQRM
jgi:hypothetical protein